METENGMFTQRIAVEFKWRCVCVWVDGKGAQWRRGSVAVAVVVAGTGIARTFL